ALELFVVRSASTAHCLSSLVSDCSLCRSEPRARKAPRNSSLPELQFNRFDQLKLGVKQAALAAGVPVAASVSSVVIVSAANIPVGPTAPVPPAMIVSAAPLICSCGARPARFVCCL